MIPESTPVNNYQGNNSSNTFDFNFYIDNANQLNVYLFENNIKYKLDYLEDYEITGIKNINGGQVIFPKEGSKYGILNTNQKLSIELNLPIAQECQYNNSDKFNNKAIEYSFDYLTRLIQILSRKIERCLKTEECSEASLEEIINNVNSCATIANTSKVVIEDYKETIENKISVINNAFEDFISKKQNFDNSLNAFYESDTIENLQLGKLNTDISNITNTGKEFIMELGLPDYSRKITTSGAGTFTAEWNGYISILKYNNNKGAELYINNVQVGFSNTSGYITPAGCGFFSKGDIIQYSNATSVMYCPLKGVENG